MYERSQERSGDKQDQQALSAEEAAFRRDLEGEIGWLWRLAKAITKNPVDADDVAQETLRRAIEKNHQRRKGTPLRAWLRPIARNYWRNELAKKKVRKIDEAIDPDEQSSDYETRRIEARPDVSDIEEACKELSDDYVEILHLIDGDGLTYREAAEVLGVPIGTVNSRITRAREAVREGKKRVLARRRQERGE